MSDIAAQHGRGMGYIPEQDPRNSNFPMRMVLGDTRTPRSYTWRTVPRLDQGQDGTCVAAAWLHGHASRPLERPVSNYMIRMYYREAVKYDPWSENDGPDFNFGTSTEAGAKVAMLMGWIDGYYWANSIQDVRLALGYEGPVMAGVPWYESMFEPDADGLLRIGGSVAGGHEVELNGYRITGDLIRIHNSWSRNWGVNGEAFIKATDLERLLKEGGDACLPIGHK
jgi:hypothetical protein